MIDRVALKMERGTIYSLRKPKRHHDVIQAMSEFESYGDIARSEQGFMTDKDEFLNRKEAFIYAKKLGQVLPRKFHQYNGPDLYSEDLW